MTDEDPLEVDDVNMELFKNNDDEEVKDDDPSSLA